MNDSLDLSAYEHATDVTKIDSHTSQLTNLRLHNLEMQLDFWCMKVRQEATQDNIIGYYSALNTLFSYLLSVKISMQSEQIKSINEVADKLKELNIYWSFIKKGIIHPKILVIKKKNPKNFWAVIENNMIQSCDDIMHDIRRVYQGLNYYFRTSQTPEVTGILGDIVAITRRKKKEKGENNELEGTNAQSNGNS